MRRQTPDARRQDEGKGGPRGRFDNDHGDRGLRLSRGPRRREGRRAALSGRCRVGAGPFRGRSFGRSRATPSTTALLAQRIHDVVASERWDLIERVATRVAETVLEDRTRRGGCGDGPQARRPRSRSVRGRVGDGPPGPGLERRGPGGDRARIEPRRPARIPEDGTRRPPTDRDLARGVVAL